MQLDTCVINLLAACCSQPVTQSSLKSSLLFCCCSWCVSTMHHPYRCTFITTVTWTASDQTRQERFMSKRQQNEKGCHSHPVNYQQLTAMQWVLNITDILCNAMHSIWRNYAIISFTHVCVCVCVSHSSVWCTVYLPLAPTHSACTIPRAADITTCCLSYLVLAVQEW